MISQNTCIRLSVLFDCYSYDLFCVVVAKACGGHHHLPESGRGTGNRTGTKGIPHQSLRLDPSTVDSHY